MERDADVAPPVPGRQSLVQQSIAPAPAEVQRKVAAEPADQSAPMPELPSYASIQRLFANKVIQAKAGATRGTPDVHAAVAEGISGPSSSLPHLDQIQRSFGHHDVSHVQAHVGGPATAGAKAMGAEAFATGDHVAFAGPTSLHIAAHEAAHVVQQRGGVQLAGGVGKVGDTYEQHADQVADAVVKGESAEALLDRHAGGRVASSAPVQRKEATPDQLPTAQNALPGVGAALEITPDDVAEFIARRPDLRADILEWAERTEGAAYVQEVLAAEKKLPQARAPAPTGPAAGSSAGQGPAPHDASKATPPPAVHTDAAQAPRAASGAVTSATGSYLEKYTSLGGTNIASLKTTRHEADILNAIRHSDQRFDPAWLAKAQTQLGVAPSGAFNTETLRAMTARHPRLDAESILANRGGLLTQLVPGTPFIATTDGFGPEKREATGATKADRAAHRLGYADYKSFHSTFMPATFLGVELTAKQGTGLAHPHLLDRLRVAEAFLRQRHPEAKSDKDVIHAIGWNKAGNAAYEDDTKYGKSHFHTMGLAIDIDVRHNPYIFTGRSKIGKNDSDSVKKEKEAKNWWMDLFDKHLGYAAKIFGGEKISAASLDSWAANVSTDELYARVTEISQSFAKYLAIANDPDDKLLARFTAAGISADVAQADLAEVHQMPHYFQMKSGGQATTLTNHSQELLVALRDVAGLAWGGAEMSPNENGDFMHFDCRQDSLGRVLQSFNFP